MTFVFTPPRAYQSAPDLEAMRRVLRAGTLAKTGCYYIHTGDLNWWLFYPPIGHDLFQHTFLWDDPTQPGSLLGWMLVDPSWPSLDVFLQPDLLGTALAREMYAYAEEQAYDRSAAAAGKPLHKLWVAEADQDQRSHLESRGFALTSWDTAFACSLGQAIPTPSLPEGFSLRPCQGLEEVEARATAQYGAFGGTMPMEPYLRRFRGFMESEAYAGALDMVAAAPDGRIAAFCIAWTDPVTGYGNLEPVGTHPDFQRMGLGKAALLGALRWLKRQGMDQAIVITSESNTAAAALYRSVGFEPARRLGHYEKGLS